MPEPISRVRRVVYTVFAPVYDLTVRPFARMRWRSIRRLDPRPGERLLIIGVGTGLDLKYLPAGLRITAIDITPAMVKRLRKRAARLGLEIDARVMDAQALDLPDASFDLVILHLILAVVPDPVRCAREAARVLRPGGRAVILDKFIADERRTPLWLRVINPVAELLVTSLTRRLGAILAGSGLNVLSNEPAGLGGLMRIVLVQKTP